MSALQSSAARAVPLRSLRPAPQPAQQSAGPRLRLVEAPAQERSATLFIALCVSLLMIAVLAVLFMNTEMANGAYKQRALSTEISGTALTTQTLQSSLDGFVMAENLAKRAVDLGMVQMVNPGVISLVDSKILVTPTLIEK